MTVDAALSARVAGGRRHLVQATRTEWVASREALCCQPATTDGTMTYHGLYSVDGARGDEPT